MHEARTAVGKKVEVILLSVWSSLRLKQCFTGDDYRDIYTSISVEIENISIVTINPFLSEFNSIRNLINNSNEDEQQQ